MVLELILFNYTESFFWFRYSDRGHLRIVYVSKVFYVSLIVIDDDCSSQRVTG